MASTGFLLFPARWSGSRLAARNISSNLRIGADMGARWVSALRKLKRSMRIRAFAVFKLWLAESAERNPSKKQRDLAQAKALLAVIQEFLPQYPMDTEALKMFPRDVVEHALGKQP